MYATSAVFASKGEIIGVSGYLLRNFATGIKQKQGFTCGCTFLSYRALRRLGPCTETPIRIFRKTRCGR